MENHHKLRPQTALTCYLIPMTRQWRIYMQCRSHRRRRFHPRVRKIPWRRKWQPTSILAWKIPWTKEPAGLQSDMTEQQEWELDHGPGVPYRWGWIMCSQGWGVVFALCPASTMMLYLLLPWLSCFKGLTWVLSNEMWYWTVVETRNLEPDCLVWSLAVCVCV